MEDPDFDAAIGARIRSLREDWRCSADQLATCARQYGLRWSRSTVSKIESGDRPLSARELFVLAWLLDGLAHKDQGLRYIETGTPDGPKYLAGPTLDDFLRFRCRMTDSLVLSQDSLRKILGLPYHPGSDDPADPGHPAPVGNPAADPADATASYTETEQHAARRLNIDVAELSDLAYDLWGPHGFVEEREWRVSCLRVDRTVARSLQAVRGQVTRKLIAEIEEERQRQSEEG